MIIDIKIPSPGESINEVELATWHVKSGDRVEKDMEIASIESDKATLDLISEESGKIEILVEEGQTIAVGEIACKIDTEAKGKAITIDKEEGYTEKHEEQSVAKTAAVDEPKTETPVKEEHKNVKITPVAQKMMQANNLNIDDVLAGLKRIGKKEIEQIASTPFAETKIENTERQEERKKMSNLRKKISERLVYVKNQTAMLTTFNEIDMSATMQLRKRYKEAFINKHGVKLGFMSIFTKAASIALEQYPAVNSMIDENEIISYNYADIGIAVQTPKGLMVPVIRDTQDKDIPQLEKDIFAMAEKAKAGKISIDDLSGGTFTITNGGVFGSLLSTPILNPPQSGILGMHNIVERPIAVSGKVEIRPMMYIALSYDHRIIDGKDSVGFLKTIKELIENPSLLFTNGSSYEEKMLGLE